MRVLYHGNCFDGCVSAALFSLFYRACIRPEEEMEYVGLTHGPRGPLSDALFGDGENVIVDFRYSESDSLTWWFDHHHSAFYSADARSHFEKSRESGQFVFDDKAPSCAGLLARAVSEKYGFDLTPYKNLIEWAECIDSASFPDAETAVMLPDVPLKLMLFLEANTNEALEKTVIRGLQEHTMQEVFEFEEIQSAFLPIWERHLETIDVIRAQAQCDGDTVYFDLTETPLQQYNKFIPYYLFPEAVYAVGLLSTEKRVKVGVGSNPWAQERRTHQIADLCESYGGGGHPAVGAISLAPGDLKQGRQVLGEVVAALKSD
jgi:hypothetical protein